MTGYVRYNVRKIKNLKTTPGSDCALNAKHHKEKYIKKGCQNRVIYQSLNSHFSHYPTSFDISSESVNIQILSHLLSSLRNYLAFSESFSEPSSTGAVTGSSFRMHGDTETLPLAASLACFDIKTARILPWQSTFSIFSYSVGNIAVSSLFLSVSDSSYVPE